MGYEPLENTYYFIIRECLARCAVQEAQLAIESMARQNLKLKLRTYELLFRRLLDKSNVSLLTKQDYTHIAAVVQYSCVVVVVVR